MKAIIVGAGPAGLATARWLRRAGWECLLIEHRPPSVPISLSEGAARGPFPADTPSTSSAPATTPWNTWTWMSNCTSATWSCKGSSCGHRGATPPADSTWPPFVVRSTAGGSHCYVVTWRRFCTTPSTRGWRFDKG